MPSLTNTALDGVLNPVINALLAADPVSSRTALGIGTLYNVDDYNASGSGGTSTTGNISASSAALTVASAATFAVGQGVYIAGAGAAGVAHVTSITAINGLVLTLAANAATTVAGAVVQHDDSAAINAAIAACYAGGGGTVYFPNGRYRCNAPLNATTNSVITFPQDHSVGGPTQIKIELRGEAKGLISPDCRSVLPGGVTIDCSSVTTISGIRPAAIAANPWNLNPGWGAGNEYAWNKIHLYVEDFLLVVANKKLSGINWHNASGLTVGDNVVVASLAPNGPLPSGFPGYVAMVETDSYGIIFPAYLNPSKLYCGSSYVIGFGTGIEAGEHLFLKRPVVWLCHTGLLLPAPGSAVPIAHLITGDIEIETCIHLIVVKNEKCKFDLRLQYEARGDGEWYDNITGFFGIGQPMGSLSYSGYSTFSMNSPHNLTVVGGEKVRFHDNATGITHYGMRTLGTAVAGSLAALTLGSNSGTVAGSVNNVKLRIGEAFFNGTWYYEGFGSSTTGTEWIGAQAQDFNFYNVNGNLLKVGATGNLSIPIAGRTLSVKSGSNALAGTFTANGTTPVAVATTAWDANCAAIITLKTSGGTGPTMTPFVSSVTPGTGFSVVSVVGDTSVYNWVALKVN